ncbi:MAG: MoaD/ThiS family protein [Candidatus Thorarchaeota archaeon]
MRTEDCGETMLEIHLYGLLRSMVEGTSASEDTIIYVEYVSGETFSQLIERMGLQMKELGDCFVNGTLARPDTPLADGDRIGLFPFNMTLLCGGQHLKGHGLIQSDIEVDYY